jgi:hypothetical protein
MLRNPQPLLPQSAQARRLVCDPAFAWREQRLL